MYKILSMIAALALSGCAKPMSYEDVQKAEAYCKRLDMEPVRQSFEGVYLHGQIVSIVCKDRLGNVFIPVVDK